MDPRTPVETGEETPLSHLEILDEEDCALSGVNASETDLRLREAYRKARCTDASCADDSEAGRLYRLAVTARLHKSARRALCFSGGGIRSATFGLGVLQGLAAYSPKVVGARPKLLGEIDYLSTVSGGGYLGSWFSAWATRRSKIAESPAPTADCATPPPPPTVRLKEANIPDLRDGVADVIKELASVPDLAFAPEQAPVKHLRAFSNYLSPKLGFLSFDSWALAATVLRNMFLNWLVLLPAFAAVLLIPVLAWRIILLETSQVDWKTLWALLLAGLFWGSWATAYVGFDLPSAGNGRRSSQHFLTFCMLPLSLCAIALNIFWAWLPPGGYERGWWDVVGYGKHGITWWHFGIFGALMHGGGMVAGILHVKARFGRPATTTGIVATIAAFFAGFVGGIAGWGASHLALGDPVTGFLYTPKLYVCLAFPLLMSVFMFSGTLLVGATSYVTEDEDREWWARAGGWFLAVGLGWLVFATVPLFAPETLNWLDVKISAALTALTGFTGFAAAQGGRSVNSSSGRRENDNEGREPGSVILKYVIRYGIKIFLPTFLVLLVMLLAMLNDRLLILWDGPPDGRSLVTATARVIELMLGYVLLCAVASWFINVNKFSLHAMYRQRLIRAYLGASNFFRQPHPFTGFDKNDNIAMCALTAYKPMHVVNMALNLVHGSNLGWQERKAASFTSTRLHTGGLCVGYRTSTLYGGRYRKERNKTPISLGTAITISGAAASPNMGYHSSPLLTLVMTLFNARLGWWLGNPRSESNIWKLPSPRWGIRSFFDEAFGLTTDDNSWIYLSDGGHFENLAMYEMVMRRCHSIVVSDAGCDPDYTYEDLANAVRKIRIDLGIPIDFDDPTMPMSPAKRPTPDHIGKHCAIGRIKYSTVDGPEAPDGILIYIKPSLNGNEPADVAQYAAANPTFPHQPTSDQFFDESQFESYRRLGLHEIEEILHTADGTVYQYSFDEFVSAVMNYVNR